MDRIGQERRWFWATLMLSSLTITAVVFSAWELVENRFFRGVDYLTLHYLYITRGIASSLLLAFWAAWYVVRQRRRSEEELRRSRERYRGLLESSPSAVALCNDQLRVMEWNAAAERLYGFSKIEVLGQRLTTVPPEKQEEMQNFLKRVHSGESILDAETLRLDSQGRKLEVQLSLLPFRETPDETYFLEVTTDISERSRLRRKLLEIEKLTSMGRMAAGTAHHLNTPLAAMLLRVQMMQERYVSEVPAADLDRLESGIRFCQHFVERLLQFGRHAPIQKSPVEIGTVVSSMASFLTPAVASKRAHIRLNLNGAGNEQVFADRNLLEALFSILLSNALDAVAPEGTITVRYGNSTAEWIVTEIVDDGCGISPSDLAHVFEPFFTTKGPGKGTGLGLAIAQNIVLELGGTISLASVQDKGTTVFIQLPRYGALVGNEELLH